VSSVSTDVYFMVAHTTLTCSGTIALIHDIADCMLANVLYDAGDSSAITTTSCIAVRRLV
jgi:hypothetical protein